MTLRITLSIDGNEPLNRTIAVTNTQRQSGSSTVYEVVDETNRHWLGNIVHRRSDGAEALAATALRMAANRWVPTARP